MTRVLIVDDELLVRVGVKSSIDWGKYGFEVIGEASNGEEALAILRSEEVDIVLLDIEMPVVNGIEVLEAIKKEEIEVKVIILSCHEDFRFAQQALRLGAVDYILKLSVSSKKLLELLLGIQKSIKTSIVENKTINLQEEWRRITVGESEFSLSTLQKKGSKLFGSDGCLIMLGIDYSTRKRKSSSVTELRIFSQSIINLTSEIVNNFVLCDVFWIDDTHYIVVMNSHNRVREDLEQMLKELQKALYRYMQITVSVTVGTENVDLHSIRKHLNLLMLFDEKRFLECPETIRYYKEMLTSDASNNKILFDTSMEEELETAIEFGDEEKATSVLNKYFSIVSETEPSFERVKFNRDIEEILHLYSKELKHYNQQFQDIEGYDMIVERSEIRYFKYIGETIEWILAFNKLYFRHLMKMREKTMDQSIRECMDYIHIHYRDEITVSMLAEHFSMSASYFGTLFKKKVGVNLNQYLTDYRMELAKVMLRTTDKTVTEISDEIGYENIYYFSNVFKKKFDMSPNVYRKSLKK